MLLSLCLKISARVSKKWPARKRESNDGSGRFCFRVKSGNEEQKYPAGHSIFNARHASFPSAAAFSAASSSACGEADGPQQSVRTPRSRAAYSLQPQETSGGRLGVQELPHQSRTR